MAREGEEYELEELGSHDDAYNIINGDIPTPTKLSGSARLNFIRKVKNP
jgi:hypothetical protein